MGLTIQELHKLVLSYKKIFVPIWYIKVLCIRLQYQYYKTQVKDNLE